MRARWPPWLALDLTGSEWRQQHNDREQAYGVGSTSTSHGANDGPHSPWLFVAGRVLLGRTPRQLPHRYLAFQPRTDVAVPCWAVPSGEAELQREGGGDVYPVRGGDRIRTERSRWPHRHFAGQWAVGSPVESGLGVAWLGIHSVFAASVAQCCPVESQAVLAGSARRAAAAAAAVAAQCGQVLFGGYRGAHAGGTRVVGTALGRAAHCPLFTTQARRRVCTVELAL